MNLKEKIISLIDKSNETTSKGDPDLTESVKTLCEGYGIGLNNNNIKFGSFDLPNNVFQSKFIETGFEPVNVIAYVFDTTNQLHTYTVCYGYDKSHQKGEYYQTDGFSRSFTADNTTGSNKGHVIGVTENGFNVQTCESYFANTMCQYVAVGRPIIKDLANIMGVTPLTLSNSLGKILVSWNMTGDIKQDVGTYTAAAMEVTADGIEDETDYPYFNTSNFENVVVGDEVNFSGDGLSYPMTAKKIEDGNVYFENTGIDDTVTGTVPLTLEKANGKELKSWSITGNTEQNVTPTPAESSEVKGVGNKTDQLIPFPFLSDISSKPTFEPKIIKGLTVYVDEHGVIHIDGTSNANNVDIYIFGGWNSTAYNLGVKNLYITCSSNKVDGYVGIYEKSQNAYRFISSYSKTNISDSDFINFIFLRVSNSGTTFDNEEIRVMASETGFTEFKPYGYGMPIESGGLSTTIYLNTPLMTDEILKSDGTRDVKWGKYAFTGNEMLFKNDTQPNNYLFYTYISQISSNIKKDTGFCTHLKIIDEPPVDSIGMNIKNRFDAVYLNFGIDIMTSQPSGNTVEGLMEYLKSEYNKGTPVTVWYQLATPTTKIIDIPTIPTIKGVTVLDIDSEVKPTYLSAEYTKSIDFSKPVTRDYSFNYPSPGHTSEVKGVGDKTEQLIPSDITWVDGYISSNGQMYQPDTLRREKTSDFISCNSLTDVTFSSYFPESIKDTEKWFGIGLYNNEKQFIKRIFANNQSYMTGDVSGASYLRITYRTYADEIVRAMLNEGSEPIPYKPFGYEIPVVDESDNLLDVNFTNETIAGISYKLNSDKTITVSGIRENANAKIIGSFKVKAGEQYCVNLDGFTGISLRFYDYDTREVYTTPFTATTDGEIYVTLKGRVDGEEVSGTGHVWANKGSTVLPYTPYREPIATPIYLNTPLMADEQLKSDETRDIKWKKVYLKDLQWIVYGTYGNQFLFYSDGLNGKIRCADSSITHGLCSDYKAYPNSMIDTMPNYSFRVRNSDGRLYFNNTNYNNLSDFINSLEDSYLYYILLTPTSETVDVPEIPTLTGNCTIDVDTEVKPVNMSITYKKTL